jgi:dephospho-CoA kinase
LLFRHAYVLTGGIACGKSSVSQLLKSDGFNIVDADIIAKEQLNLHVQKAKKLFGEQICINGIIDRKKLGKIVFSSKEQRVKLNNFLHPLIREEIQKQARKLDQCGVAYIMDIPLYFESGGEYNCKFSVVVYAPKEIQLKRLMARDKISEEEALCKVNSQIDIDKKRKMGDWVIDNSSNLENLEQQTKEFIDKIKEEYANIKI